MTTAIALSPIQSQPLDAYRSAVTAEQELTLKMAEEVLEEYQSRGLKAPPHMERQALDCQKRLAPLRLGFTPTEGVPVLRLPPGLEYPRSKRRSSGERRHRSWGTQWNRNQVQRAIKHLPDEVKATAIMAQKCGLFDYVAVSNPQRSADPMVFGVAGGWPFLLSTWIPLRNGQGFGFTVDASKFGETPSIEA